MSDESILGSAHDAFLETEERRAAGRRTSRAEIRLVVDSRELTGRAENVSESGVLFFSPGELRVSVEIDEHGTKQVRSGRLVRAQRLRGDQIGWAVEFDPA